MMNRGELSITESTEKERRVRIPARCALPIMGFFGYLLINSNRLNMSVTIVAMVNATSVYGKPGEIDNNTAMVEEHRKDGEFIWSPKQQGLILGAYFWILGIGSLTGSRICEIIGCKKVFGLGMLIMSLLALITPISARYHWYALIAVRVLSGFFQGVIYPAFARLIGRWIPPPERSFAMSVVYGGQHFGSFATILVSGYLCDSEFLDGWPSVHYIYGIIGCLWCLLFKFLVYETPSEHPWISDHELRYILDTNKPLSAIQSSSIPWKSICLSPAVWSLIMVCFATRWAQFHFHTVHPTYMATILKFPIVKNGLLSSLPHLLLWIVVLISGFVSDVIRRKKCIGISANHKCFATAGMLGYVVCLAGVIGVGYDVTWNVSLLIIAMGFTGMTFVGETVAVVDMSPHFSGILLGIRGILSTSTGYIVPTIVGVLTEEQQTMAQWRIVFYISMAVAIVCTLTFDIVGSAEKQPWDPSYEKAPENNQCPPVLAAKEKNLQKTRKL